MGIFYCYVSLPEGNPRSLLGVTLEAAGSGLHTFHWEHCRGALGVRIGFCWKTIRNTGSDSLSLYIYICSMGSLLTFIFYFWVGEHPLETDHVTDATVHEKKLRELHKQLVQGGSEKLLLSKHVSVSCRVQLVLFQLSWCTNIASFSFECSEQPLGAPTRLTKLENMLSVKMPFECFLINCSSLPRYIHYTACKIIQPIHLCVYTYV